MLGIVERSLQPFTPIGGAHEAGWTAENYLRFFSTRIYLDNLLQTLRIAGLATVQSLVLGYPLAYAIARTRSAKLRNLLLALTVGSFLSSGIIKVFSWLVVAGNLGLVNNILSGLGFGRLELLYNENVVIVGLSYIHLPLMVLTLAAVLQRLDRTLEDSAMDLGANPLQVFVHVTLPLSMPGIIAGSIITFVYGLGAFLVPVILGGTRGRMISNIIFEQFSFTHNIPFGSAVALILLSVVVVILLIQSRIWQEAPHTWSE